MARVGVPIFIILTPPAPIRAAIPDVSDDVRVELASVKAEMIGLRGSARRYSSRARPPLSAARSSSRTPARRPARDFGSYFWQIAHR